LGGNKLEVDHHPLLNVYVDPRLKSGNEPLKFDGYGINADLDWCENVPPVAPGVSGSRYGSPLVLKEDFGAGCSLTGWISNGPANGP
jgi:hypothetical protein